MPRPKGSKNKPKLAAASNLGVAKTQPQQTKKTQSKSQALRNITNLIDYQSQSMYKLRNRDIQNGKDHVNTQSQLVLSKNNDNVSDSDSLPDLNHRTLTNTAANDELEHFSDAIS